VESNEFYHRRGIVVSLNYAARLADQAGTLDEIRQLLNRASAIASKNCRQGDRSLFAVIKSELGR
jgi:hypothetical protein